MIDLGLRWLRIGVFAASLCVTGLAIGGGGGSAAAGKTHDPARLAVFVKQVERAMAARGARLALLARTGIPEEELPEGVRYTHVGLAVYSRISTPVRDDPASQFKAQAVGAKPGVRLLWGYATHNLYQLDERPDRSHLVQDFPLDFFAGAAELRAGVVIPSPALQQRLLQLLAQEQDRALHNPHYSVIDNPLDGRYQNCTSYVLDLLFAAIYQSVDPARLRGFEARWFEPQPLHLGGLELALGRLFRSDVRDDDHQGPIRVATMLSIARFLREQDLMVAAFEIDADGREQAMF